MQAPSSFAAFMAAGFRGAAKRALESDFAAAGREIGTGAAEVRTFTDVESAGAGFYPDGRIKMLFEPHKFYAKLSGAKRAKAVAAGLAYRDWRPNAYPRDSYPRLIQAMQIDADAALESASWGLTQIMGEHWHTLGYASPQAMVLAFAAGEGEHLRATVLLLKAWGLDDELRAHDWPRIARGWNGPQYAKHGYHLKLALAYARRAKGSTKPIAKAALAPVAPPKLPPRKPVPVGLPAVAPLSFGERLAAFLAGLFPPQAAAPA